MNTIDEKIKKLFDVINEKKAQIAKLEKPTYLTNMSFPVSENSSERINLHTVKSETQLVKILATLSVQKNEFDKICEKFNLKAEYEYAGFTFKDWENDIVTCINRLNIKREREDLVSKESKLNQLISPEERRRLEVESLEKDLLG